MRVFALFIDICSKHGTDVSLLGYLAALLSLKGDNTAERIKQNMGGGTQFLWNTELIPDTKNASLLFTFLSVILKNASSETESETVYSLLKDGIKFMPSAFPSTYSILVERLGNVLEMGQNEEIFEHVISILDSMFSEAMNDSKRKTPSRVTLTLFGFNGLPNLSLFTPSIVPSSSGSATVTGGSSGGLNSLLNSVKERSTTFLSTSIRKNRSSTKVPIVENKIFVPEVLPPPPSSLNVPPRLEIERISSLILCFLENNNK